MKAVAYELMSELEDFHWWYRARRQIVLELIRRLLPANKDILDYGAGTGGMACSLREFGYNVIAADISEEALGACRLRGLATMDLNQESLGTHSMDCVLAADVLEHVHDDVDLLFSMRRALRPGGLLVVTVPAYDFLWSGEDYVSDHFRRYSRKRLLECLDLAGFRLIWCSYFNTLLFPVIASIRITKRLLFPEEMYTSDVTALPDWQNEILGRIFAFERHLLKRVSLPVGTSLLAAARPVDAA